MFVLNEYAREFVTYICLRQVADGILRIAEYFGNYLTICGKNGGGIFIDRKIPDLRCYL
jgi:hypothetical protein